MQLFNRIPSVTKNLLIINVLIYIAMALMPASRSNLITMYGGLHYFASPGFNPAQLVTYMFIHGNFTHLFFNMFALLMFGPMIEYSLGSKRFLFYYLSCGIGAALVQEVVFAIMLANYTSGVPSDIVNEIIDKGWQAWKHGKVFVDPMAGEISALVNHSTVGASGAIYGILLAFGMLFPNMQLMLVIPPMPIKAKWLVIGYAVIELVEGVAGTADGVAHFCHLGGMLVGLLIILYWRKKGTFNGYY